MSLRANDPTAGTKLDVLLAWLDEALPAGHRVPDIDRGVVRKDLKAWTGPLLASDWLDQCLPAEVGASELHEMRFASWSSHLDHRVLEAFTVLNQLILAPLVVRTCQAGSRALAQVKRTQLLPKATTDKLKNAYGQLARQMFADGDGLLQARVIGLLTRDELHTGRVDELQRELAEGLERLLLPAVITSPRADRLAPRRVQVDSLKDIDPTVVRRLDEIAGRFPRKSSRTHEWEDTKQIAMLKVLRAIARAPDEDWGGPRLSGILRDALHWAALPPEGPIEVPVEPGVLVAGLGEDEAPDPTMRAGDGAVTRGAIQYLRDAAVHDAAAGWSLAAAQHALRLISADTLELNELEVWVRQQWLGDVDRGVTDVPRSPAVAFADVRAKIELAVRRAVDRQETS